MMKRAAIALMLTAFLSVLSAHSAAADAVTLAQTVQAGSAGEYQIEIANETTDSHDYHLTVDGLPDTLTLSFVQDGPVLDTVAVDAGSYTLVTLRVDVPADTAVGRYAGSVTATRDDGSALTVPIVLNVENTYSVEIVSQNLNVTTFRGQEFTFDVTASNIGAAPLTNLSLVVGAPAKWVVQIDPAVVASLDPGADAAYHARVLVPRSQIAIDQPVTLSIISDQASSAESTLTVRVQNNPGYLVVAAIVILAAVIGVVVYFRARGRR
jgi:uncharacterized membrane protein